MTDISPNDRTKWSPVPIVFALVCVAIGAWIQLRTPGLVAIVGAPLYVIAAAVTLFAAFVAGHRSALRTVPSYVASIALVVAILFQWDGGVEPHSTSLRVVELLGSDRYRAPSFFTSGPLLVMNSAVAVPWLVASIAALVHRRGELPG